MTICRTLVRLLLSICFYFSFCQRHQLDTGGSHNYGARDFEGTLLPGVRLGWSGGFNVTKSDDKPAEPKRSSSETSELGARIRKAQEARAAANGSQNASRQGDMSTLARGLRIGAEFVAAILVGSGIGYVIDLAAGTSPWALLIMFMLGFAAGILNVTRVVAELNAQKPASDDAEKLD
ncbi:AtpZ/AtpI family protein [Pelagibacterium luteolum]|uniref:ATP synthase protein I n=1 Tax=Pelagibacterium luteolum TaxID=440168 RepID=A0A1G7TXT0_9HYPH|nr:AtpZ/AtpI family protein [Pelagibacterium luteolum]SDG39958.1 ATP synthase protein I [Pelagibacterium luteolum]